MSCRNQKGRKSYFDMQVVKNDDDQPHNEEDTEQGLEQNGIERIVLYKHPPFFMVFISIFQLVTFVYYAIRSDEQISSIGPVPFNSRLIYNPRRRYEIWRFLTYCLIHAGYWHLIFNILSQLIFGFSLEIIHDFHPIAIIYTGGIISGSLGNSIFDPLSYLAGSSAGCYALIAANLSNLMINWRYLQVEQPCFKLASLLIFCSFDFGIAIYERHLKPGSIGSHTSYAGHVCGFVAGFLLGLIHLKRFRTRSYDRNLKLACMYIFYSLILCAVLINIISINHFPIADYREQNWALSPYFIHWE